MIATQKVKKDARVAVAQEGIQFYLEQARDKSNPAPFRKQCWDKLFDVGFGKPAQQKEKTATGKRRILVTGLPSRKDPILHHPNHIEADNASDEEETAVQPNMAEEEQDEPYDQADVERWEPLRDSAGFPVISPPPG